MRQIPVWWVAAICCGCLDLNLLDDMNPVPDTDSASEEAEEGADESSAAGSDGDAPSADSSDVTPPAVVPSTCAAAERSADNVCIAEGPVSATVRFVTDEAASVTLSDAATVTTRLLSDSWTRTHRAVTIGLSEGAETALLLSVSDINGNETELSIALRGTGGPAAAITEVSADPAGAEPAQEFVEIANIGDTTLDLSGWMLDDNDEKDGDLLPEGTMLQAGGVALLVPSTYDAASSEDPSPDAAALLIYLDGSIGTNGLKNSEAEPVVLYDSQGNVVSVYDGRMGTPSEGVSVVRCYAELPDADPDAFCAEAGGTSTPGLVGRLM